MHTRLFKLEFNGLEITALCSKTYAAEDENKQDKLSSKGVKKNIVLYCNRVQTPLSIYKHVFNDELSKGAINYGFRMKDNYMYTFRQERNTFTYFYCKQKVCDDGIHTTPLYIVLSPWYEVIDFE